MDQRLSLEDCVWAGAERRFNNNDDLRGHSPVFCLITARCGAVRCNKPRAPSTMTRPWSFRKVSGCKGAVRAREPPLGARATARYNVRNTPDCLYRMSKACANNSHAGVDLIDQV
jgi:hypothetical protein